MKVQEQPRLRKELVIGFLFAAGAAFSYGAGQVVSKMVVTELASPAVAAFFAAFFGMVGLFFLGLRDMPRDLRAPRGALLLVLLSGILASLGFLCLFIALSKAPVVVVSPVSAISPLMSVALSQIFLRSLETASWRTVVGALLIVIGVAFVLLGST